ncbi:hypothetical protein [Streptomyces sp. NPDC126514]|uniref:hypothetical protein n=1 Tax=Streptomyces sp. NPDC126514 TaxID=3155210 RepID=UPI00332EA680
MHAYIIGHSEYNRAAPLVRSPQGFEDRIRFYSTPDQVLPRVIGVSLLALSTRGVPIITPESELMVPNYEFFPIDSRDIDAVYALAHRRSLDFTGRNGRETITFPDSLDPQQVHIVGAQLPIPSSGIVQLCDNPSSPECSTGSHNCTGVFGTYKGYSLDFVSCRAPSEGERLVADLSSYGGQVGDITDEMQHLLDLLAKEPKETLFDGTFAKYWDELGQGNHAVFKYHTEIFKWCELRHAWTASNKFADRETLGKYIVSQYSEGSKDVLSILMSSPLIIPHLPQKYYIQAYALELLLSRKYDEFAEEYKKQPTSVRNIILEHPALKEAVNFIVRK